MLVPDGTPPEKREEIAEEFDRRVCEHRERIAEELGEEIGAQ